MGWTAPRTWVAGEIVTASIMNSAIRDNLLYIKGVGQVPTIESGLTIDNTDGDERLLLPLLTTVECGNVLNAEGEVAFDEQTHQMKEYDGTAVRALISEADVDDTPVNGADTVPVSSNWAYDFQQTLTTEGDLPYATAAGVWTRLAKGTASQFLRMNAGATAPEWTSGAIPQYGIIIWTGTIANIPVGFVICDGNNSSPNLLTKFLEGVATAATDPGATGGATSKNTGGADSVSGYVASSGSTQATIQTHIHTTSDIRPLFYDVAFIMKT